MAPIGSQFDLNKALSKESYAYDCWVNKNYENNTLGITNPEMSQITNYWGYECVSSWKAEAEQDYNEYEISDEEFDLGVEEGEEGAKTKTEFDGDITQDKDETIATGVSSGVGILGAGATVGVAVGAASAAATAATAAQTAATAAVNASLITNSGLAGASAAQAGAAAAEAEATAASATASTMSTASKVCCYVGCAMALAIGILYEATRPNKKPYEALMQLKDLMLNSQNNLQAQQHELDAIGECATTKAGEAESEQETKQQELEEKAQLLALANGIMMDLQARYNAGEPITATELAKLNAAKTQIGSLGQEVSDLSGELLANSTEKSAIIGDLSSQFDEKALNIANALGQAEFAASFDEATKNLCALQIASQTLNIVSGGISAGLAATTGPWGWAFAAMGVAGVGMSTHGVIEQSKFHIGIKEEIDIRTGLQNTVTQSLGIYDMNIDKQAVSSDIAASANSLEGIEQFEQALANAESVTIEVTPQTPQTTGGINPFGSLTTDGKENDGTKKNPFSGLPKLS